jgi:pentatricopeptide repeat protein
MPNAASYNITLHTLAHSEKGNKMAMEASAILDRMIDRCRNYLNMKDDPSLPLPPPEPTIITFNSIIHAIAKSGADNAGHMAEEVFSKMEDWNIECKTQNRCYTGVSPNSRTLACVLDAWTNRDDIKGFSPERAESILNMAINRRRAYVKSVIGDSYDSTFSESGESDSFIGDDDIVEEYAEEDLESKQEVVQEYVEAELRDEECCGPFLRPNAVAFNTCINAWATCGRGRVAAVRTQELLRRMEAISESGELDLPYTDIDCDIDNDGSTLVDHSLRPNLRSYALVMKAWANVAKMERWSNEDAAEQCEAILNRMEKRGASDVSVRPNLVAYVTTITAWSRTKIDSAASRAEAILNRMVDLYYDGDKFELPSLERELEHAKHDAPFNSVITAYARSSDPIAAERAFAVLERLEVSPIAQSVFTYNAVMDVCAKHGEPERALQVLERMRDFSVTPDATSYDTVLNAFARHDKSGSAERAWELLREFDSRATGFVPSRVSYSAVINGFARAAGKEYGGMHAVKKAKEVYDRLIEQIKSGEIYGRADPVASSCFLNCCANIYGTRSERRETLILAIKAFEDMKKNPLLHGDPGQYTFGTMMKACARLSSDAAEKNRLLESLFVQSCKRGFLSKSILGQFLRHTPNQFSAKVILNMGGSKREIPSEWHRNVPGKHKPIRTEHDIR